MGKGEGGEGVASVIGARASAQFSMPSARASVVLLRTRHWLKMRRKGDAAAAKSLQSCPTLCDPIDGSPPGSSVPGILQARVLEWGAISFSNA